MTQAVYQRTETVPLADLTPFPGNAKRGDVELILSSLVRNGQYRGLVVRETGEGPLVILAGNHTAEALALHGPGPCAQTVTAGGEERPCGVCGNEAWEMSARCEIVTCDDDTARRVNLVDNKSADAGEYDNDALAELLSYMDEDYEGTGYNAGDVNRLLFVPDPAATPEEFPAFDEDLPTQYTCPKCQYSWSGKPS
jgi:ParB-like chromosome segregation protein Spo0J